MSSTFAHHPIFERYERWSGEVPDGFAADLLGVRTQTRFYLTKAQQRGVRRAEGEVTPELPLFNEEYFEWVDVLEAVDQAEKQFTMVELGAGWGRWLAIGAAAARQRGLPAVLVGVEAEPSHYLWMVEHLRENNPEAAVRLHEAAVAGQDGAVFFHVGDPVAWYGQAIDPYSTELGAARFTTRVRSFFRGARAAMPTERGKTRVEALSLSSVLQGLERVDLIDLDVQGAEAEVLEAGATDLDSKVKRVHIGTHSVENEERCRALFDGLGWAKRNDFPFGGESVTEYGTIAFQDGVQTWINPRLNTEA